MEIRFVSIVAFRTALDNLLTVYPKRGPMQKLDLENGELEMLVNAFSIESKARQVVVHDINNNLAVVPQEE